MTSRDDFFSVKPVKQDNSMEYLIDIKLIVMISKNFSNQTVIVYFANSKNNEAFLTSLDNDIFGDQIDNPLIKKVRNFFIS